MSEFKRYDTQYRDKECLVAALKEQYSEVEEHEVPQPLYDFRGVTKKLAHVIVRRKVAGGYNDVGFTKDPSTGLYNVTLDGDDTRRYGQQWFDNLKKNYTEKVVAKEAKRLNLTPYIVKTVGNKKVIQYLVN